MSVILLTAAGAVLVLDQFTKTLVVRYFAGQAAPVGSWIRIRYVENAGRTRRLFRSRLALLLVWLSVLGMVVLVLQQGAFFHHPAGQIGLGTALGGAASNFYDRQRRGAVIDFLDVGWWPVFNLADVAITVGSMLALGFLV